MRYANNLVDPYSRENPFSRSRLTYIEAQMIDLAGKHFKAAIMDTFKDENETILEN